MALIIKNIEDYDPAVAVLFESIIGRLGPGTHREPSLTVRETLFLESLLLDNLSENPTRVIRIQLSIEDGEKRVLDVSFYTDPPAPLFHELHVSLQE